MSISFQALEKLLMKMEIAPSSARLMQVLIYSLGVVLLELGLWGLPHFRRFVSMPNEFQKANSESTIETELKMLISCSMPKNRSLGRGIHCSMGRTYRDVVEYCLDTGASDGRSGIELVSHVWNILDTAASSL
jgi:hypothetical protein